MDLTEFRQEFINEDIYAEAVNTNRYPVEVFIDHCVDILQNDYSLISDMNHSFFSFKEGTRAFKNMQIDASYLDLVSGTLNLLITDFNEGEIENKGSIKKEDIIALTPTPDNTYKVKIKTI